jgi:hypothetical protein
MIFRRFKLHLQKKYIAFFAITPLLLITATVGVRCPLCNGAGELSSTPGMSEVELISSNYQVLLVSRDVCTTYIVYAYAITLTLKNNGAHDTSGYAKVILKDYTKGHVLDTQYLPVSVPGLSSVEDRYEVAFKAGLDQPSYTKVETLIQSGNFPCKICYGSGQVALGTWTLASALEKHFREITRTEHSYAPPAYNPPDIEDREIFWVPPPDDTATQPPVTSQGSYGDGAN